MLFDSRFCLSAASLKWLGLFSCFHDCPCWSDTSRRSFKCISSLIKKSRVVHPSITSIMFTRIYCVFSEPMEQREVFSQQSQPNVLPRKGILRIVTLSSRIVYGCDSLRKQGRLYDCSEDIANLTAVAHVLVASPMKVQPRLNFTCCLAPGSLPDSSPKRLFQSY